MFFMSSIDEEMEKYDEEQEEEYIRFHEKAKSKIDTFLAYNLLCLRAAERYNIPIKGSYYPDQDFPEPIYIIVNNFVENIDDRTFEKYLRGKGAPLLREETEIRKIFPEFNFLENNQEIIDLANKIYDLDLHLWIPYYGKGYVYSLSFDFESFTHIKLDKAKKLKDEIRVLEDHNVSEDIIKPLRDELAEFGLSEKILKEL